MGAQRGVSPPDSEFPNAPSGKGSLGPLLLLWGSLAALSGEGSLEFLLLAAGFPRPRLGTPLASFPHAARVPPPGYGVPHGSEWERSLESPLAAGGFPRPRVGAQRGVPSSRLRGSYSPAGSTEWGPASMLKGSYGPGWDPRVRPLLRAAGFL